MSQIRLKGVFSQTCEAAGRTTISAFRIPKRLYYYPTVSRIFAALIGGYLFANVMSLLIFFAFVDTDLLYMETEGVNRELVASGFNASTAASMMSLVIFT